MLADDFDGYLFDLDGVIYLGPQVIPAVPDALARLRAAGAHVEFVTNNAGRSPAQMAERISGMGVACTAADVVTSGQVIVAELAGTLPAGGRVLVVGSQFLSDELTRLGLTPTRSADPLPDAVVQGWGVELDQPLLFEGCLAVGQGVPWYASNTDLTIPTERGIGPGSGSFVNLVAGVTGRRPDVVAGKPHPPLLRAALSRLGAERPIFVGDRLDTDVEGANALGIASLWVLTGAHGKQDLLQAPPSQRPTYIAADVAGLFAAPYVARLDGDQARCADAVATRTGATLAVAGGDPVAQLWALAHLAWDTPGADYTAAAASIALR